MRDYKADLWEDGSDADPPAPNVLALIFSIKKSTKNKEKYYQVLNVQHPEIEPKTASISGYLFN